MQQHYDTALQTTSKQLTELRSALDEHAIVAVTDLKGTITFVNKKFCEISGYEKHELIGQNHRLLNSGMHSALFFKHMYTTLKSANVWHGKICNKAKDGHLYWLDTTIAPFFKENGRPQSYISIRTDITEHKTIEFELKNSGDRFASLVKNVPGIIYRCEIDNSLNMLYMSDQTKDIIGYVPNELIKNKNISFFDLIHEDERTQVMQKIKLCIDAKQPWAIEYRVKAKDGTFRWVNDTGQAIYDSLNVVQYLDGFIFDITERYNAQEKINRQQDLLVSMSKQGQIGAWEVDLEAQTLYWSEEVKVIHEVPNDYEPDFNTAIKFYKPGLHRNKILELFANAQKTGDSWSVELVILTHLGNERWVKSTGQTEFENGKCVRVFGSFQSIDTHKRLELESEKANRYNKNLALLTIAPEVHNSDVSAVEMLAVKSICNVLNVERASLWIFNKNRDKLTRHSFYIKGEGLVEGDFELTENDYPVYFESINKRNLTVVNDVNSHSATVELIYDYIAPANIKSILHAVISSGDGHLGILCAEKTGEYHHWTQSEETYLRSLATLVGSTLVSSRRKEMAEELKIALVKAEDAAITKSQFLATMSHEIRTPMNGVLGMLELIGLESLAKPIETKVGIAKTSARSLLSIINDILDFSKVEAGKVELENIGFNIRDLIGEVAQAQAITAQEKGIEIILNLVALEPSQLRGDPGRIRQILTNLLSNAVKFTHKGEVVVTAKTVTTKQGITLEVTVKDTGIGINSNKQQILFTPFSQVDASTTRQYGGTGLGLAICKQLCELMKGSISFTSHQGEGSEFTATLQVAKNENSDTRIQSINAHALTILIVDGNKTNCSVISHQLAHWGALVDVVYDAEHALKVCEMRMKNQQKLYDIAFLDMQMSDMNGIKLCEKFKAHDDYKNISLIMMTSIAGMEDAQQYINAGFEAYFAKPVTTADLILALSVINQEDTHRDYSLVAPEQTSFATEEKTADLIQILLVEDNAVNQQVSTLMLKKLNCNTTLAENGQQAIDILSRYDAGYFKIVLMDCQMPVMDGFDATAAIRNGQAGNKHKNINIIALTANAMDSDKQRCIDAGMNDYLSKPIQLNILKDKLEQYF